MQLFRGDMALFQDQLQNLSTTEAEVKAAMAAAEAKAVQAEQRQQEAEAQRRQTEARWQAAKQQLEHAQTEVDTLRCICMELFGPCSFFSTSANAVAADAVKY
jgi:chromosome segregation ATPase